MLEQSIAENKFSRSLQQTREYQNLSVSQFDGRLGGVHILGWEITSQGEVHPPPLVSPVLGGTQTLHPDRLGIPVSCGILSPRLSVLH